MERKKTKKNKGITLIALVITIIVLLILAAVTIVALSGDNGILKRATESKEQTKASQLEDNVKLAINEAITNGIGEVTEENLVNALNKNVGSDNYTITGDTTNGWDIVAGGKTYHVSPSGVTTSSGGTSGGSNTETSSLDGIYSEGGITEDDIAPNDLFEYEILNNSTETAATVNTSLPVKTAKIKGIKRKYCNFYRLVGENFEETNYEIKYDGITDTLVIPYVVKLTDPNTNQEDNYTITEVSLATEYSTLGQTSLPSIENIIYPNTVKKIYGIINPDPSVVEGPFVSADHKLKKVILSDNIEEIPDYFFSAYPDRDQYGATTDYHGIEYIHLPKNLVKIGIYAFENCTNLKYIDLTNVTSVGVGAFVGWTDKQEIKVPFSKNESLPTGWDTGWLTYYNAFSNPTVIYKDGDVNYSDKDTNYSESEYYY